MIIPFARYGIRSWRGLCISTRVWNRYGGSFCETESYESDAGSIRIGGQRRFRPSWVYTRFLGLLFKFEAEIDGMFDRLVDALKALLSGFRFFCGGGFERGEFGGAVDEEEEERRAQGRGCRLGEEDVSRSKGRRNVVGEGGEVVWLQDSSSGRHEI